MMPKLQLNKKLYSLFTKHKSIKVAIGGRGSGKSIGFGDIFTFKMLVENADIYCLREYQDSITDSVHRVFIESIQDRLKLDGWEIYKNTVVAPNGAVTKYKGATRSPDSIQSAQGYKYSWFEEAHVASEESLNKLVPTIIRNPGAECWFSANPQSESDAFSKRFINPFKAELDKNGYYEDDLHLIVVINWRDNPWWSESQEQLRVWDLENRSSAEYNWIWEGQFYDTVDDALIPQDWFDSAVDAHKKLGFKEQGVKAVGFDPADDGSDAKAMAFRYGPVVKDVQNWNEGDITDAIDKVFTYADEHRVDALIYDSIGIGASIKVALKTMSPTDKITFEGFCGSEGTLEPDNLYMEDRPNKDLFRNRRAQYYWYLRDRFEKTHRAVNGEYIDPAELISLDSNIECLDTLKGELCKIKRKRANSQSMIQIESKQDMVRDGRRSPNTADALMYAFFDVDLNTDSFSKPLEYNTTQYY